MSLKSLNDFVKSLEVSANGIAFIIEPNGNLIASSVGKNVSSLPDGTNLWLTASQCGNPFVETVYAKLNDRLSRFPINTTATSFNFPNPAGGTIHAAYATIKDQAGLEWITVVAMPSSDFLGSLTDSLTHTIIIGILAVLLAIGMGDRVLIDIANRLKDNVREKDLVARYAGDEVVILLDNVATSETLETIRANIERILLTPTNTVPRDSKLIMGGSVGCALYPEDGTDADTLLKIADRHMYEIFSHDTKRSAKDLRDDWIHRDHHRVEEHVHDGERARKRGIQTVAARCMRQLRRARIRHANGHSGLRKRHPKATTRNIIIAKPTMA